jgi:SAM-dependent methyltransferase
MSTKDIGMGNATSASGYTCVICGYATAEPQSGDVGAVRGNTERFKGTLFHLWKCPQCQSIHSMDPVDYQDIYRDYPLNRRRLDIYARGTLGHLVRRLEKAGVRQSDTILDYGCGNGLFVAFLRERGFRHVSGYDPYVAEYASIPVVQGGFDCVVANDVIEHVSDPRATVRECAGLLKPGGILYLGTADSDGVAMADLEPHVMRMHQPFHRVIVNQRTLLGLGRDIGFDLVHAYRRSYMDTLRPFANYRFLDEFSKALGYNMDLALDPAAGKVLLRRPLLFFYAFFGYLFPSAFEPAVILRRPTNG